MTFTTINKTKYGNCSQCTATNTPVVKVAKDLYCLQCHRNNKSKKQLANQREKTQLRSLISNPNNKKLLEEKGIKEPTEKEMWFSLIRQKLTGTCQCGCGNKSQKNDNMYFRSSCCHLFPKKTFKSIQYNPLNYVERAFFGGCHSVFDDTSMDRWVNMADWQDIREKFFILSPLLTEQERATKFYTHLERLVYNTK